MLNERRCYKQPVVACKATAYLRNRAAVPRQIVLCTEMSAVLPKAHNMP